MTYAGRGAGILATGGAVASWQLAYRTHRQLDAVSRPLKDRTKRKGNSKKSAA